MRKKFKVLLISLLIINLMSGVILAKEQDVNKELFIPDVDYSYFKLDNGLQIYVFEDHKVPLARFSLWYKVGSIDEPEGISGISHLLEHTMFLGTNTLGKDQIHNLVKSVGGVNNASTYYDYTKYYEEVPSAKLELAMAIEADRMRNLKIKPKEFRREKQVVKQERRKRVENSIFSSALEKIQAEAFHESPLGHQVIGWMEDLNNLTVKELRDYYTRYYAPNNAVMMVSGDVEPKEVYKLAKKYYGDYKPQNIKRLRINRAKQKQERFIEIKKRTRLPMIAMIYKIPQGDHPDLVAIDALLDILINNSTSRIKTQLKKNKNIIMQAGGHAVNLRRSGFALIYSMPMDKSLLNKVKNEFDKELQRLINEGIRDEELKIVKKSALKSIIFKQKDVSAKAQTVARGVVRHNDPLLYQKEIKRLKNLTKEDIIEAAKRYFVKENRTVGYVVPKSSEQ